VSQIIDPQTSVILLDIEGTTTPVDFVYKTLFPYALHRLPHFLQEHFHEPETKTLIQQMYLQHHSDEQHGLKPPDWINGSDQLKLLSVVAYAQWLMNKNSKLAALKAIQGKIWQEGYNNGELQGQVYVDVPQAFQRWQRQKRKICIYSSGSILAQQLLFHHTLESGDLTPYITAFFDSNIGSKTEIESYRRIAESLRQIPNEFLFISDTREEIEAAYDAKMQVILCDRVRNPLQIQKLPKTKMVVSSFDEIFPN
jgi:enolase-phosphatase E1